ncbi:hypothetical protein GIB67_016764 [Kingdonia uniflora]|uniref:Dicer-like protein 4 n=1 Tax=Kingdonia uniflora TaxID=39325 RepID=A0A7J7LXT3_9MAGN|nr:hypothetical protein GIB67_016764 [Kingdonia uniflora]
MADEEQHEQQRSSSTVETRVKDPRIKARKYQLELCQKAVEVNVIVYLGTGCGKTHIAVLLMYELGHLIRKPQKSVCVFLVPTVMLVRQQADYIEESTDFKVGSYSGKRLRSHQDWEKEIEEHEDFYKNCDVKRPRIFGMTASPIVGKDPENLPKWINSLENILDAKVCSIGVNEELEKYVASPGVNIYYYDPVSCEDYQEKLEGIKDQSDSFTVDALKESNFSQKLLVLIRILSSSRPKPDMKCIIFVSRSVVAKALSFVLANLKCLEFWKCDFLVGLKNVSRKTMNATVKKFLTGELNLLVSTRIGEGLDIPTCSLVIRFSLPETVASFIQSGGRARMPKSEYAFLVDRTNENEELDMIASFRSDECRMNEKITRRTSRETFEDLNEEIYKVGSTGASISAGYSVSLLHQYCAKLPHDDNFNPKPKFIYFDDLEGTVCHIILPSNAPIHEVFCEPKPLKDMAKKIACLKACKKLHELGALTDYLLPVEDDGEKEVLIVSHKYGEDRVYQKFGFFLEEPLPREAETMEFDLHLGHGRIVRTEFVPLETIGFDNLEIAQAQNFQEMFLKIILDRKEFFSEFVPLGRNYSSQASSLTYYLLLPLRDNLTIDWNIIKTCLSSSVFTQDFRQDAARSSLVPPGGSLILFNGPVNKSDIVNSLVFTPHNKLFFFIAEILPGTDANSSFPKGRSPKASDYVEHYSRKFNIHLLHPEQPLLKAKQLFCVHNLLHDRKKEGKDARELEDHFVEIPPELCSLKIIGFSKDIGSSLSLLPSITHRLENILVAIELKHLFSSSFPEGSHVSASRRLEFLGDAVLDYLITSYLYSVYPKLKPGQLTDLRSVTVNNNSFAHVAVTRSFHKYLLSDSDILSETIKKFVNFAPTSIAEKNPLDGPTCPKVLGDLVESCVGAILLDTGFNLHHVWSIILSFDLMMTFSSLFINPVRQLRELCQSRNWDLKFSSSRKGETFTVEAQAQCPRLKKGKSLEKVLKSSTKQEAKLLGFDETSINMVDLDLVSVEHIEIAEVSPALRHHTFKTKPLNKERTSIQTTDFKATDRSPKSPIEPLGKRRNSSSEKHSSDTSSDTAGISHNGSAKSRLYEICADNYWNPPLFKCCKEEGESHVKLFTFKVTIEIDEPTSTVVECFNKPRQQKKATAEHAAEGKLLWRGGECWQECLKLLDVAEKATPLNHDVDELIV